TSRQPPGKRGATPAGVTLTVPGNVWCTQKEAPPMRKIFISVTLAVTLMTALADQASACCFKQPRRYDTRCCCPCCAPRYSPAGPSFPRAEEQPSVDSRFTFPAEWEPHESVWMGWPPVEYVKGRSFKDVQIEVIRALAGHVKVDLAVQDEKEAASVKKLLQEQRVPQDHVRFHSVPHTDIWFRDMGPLFIKNRRGDLKVVDFQFNLWGT